MRDPAVLVVDDDILIEQFIREALEEAGHDVVSTNSATEALHLLADRGREWSGLVTDINLGRGAPCGWDIAKAARTVSAAVPVIYVSGDSSHQWTILGVPLSIMVDKPFAPSRLIVALADLLNARTRF